MSKHSDPSVDVIDNPSADELEEFFSDPGPLPEPPYPAVSVYIAGPMRGMKELNFPAFMDAEVRLFARVVEAYNPARVDMDMGFDPTGLTGDENLDDLGFDLRGALAGDLGWIAENADSLLLLDGWQDSAGARAEFALAQALNLNVFTLYMMDNNIPPVPARDVQVHAAHPAPGVVADSGETRTTSSTGGEKGVKPARFDLVPVYPLTVLSELYGRGADKYQPHNWARGYEWSKSYASLMRHATQFWGGQDRDDETGLPHMAAVAFHAFALLQFMRDFPQHDDRPGVTHD